ncbi:MAG: hypothetical protein E3J30_08955 [Anaerolineales bacterium]|nr:MAG: hypothetical protein E3J30_08955 [Anaerolineales bacterium]
MNTSRLIWGIICLVIAGGLAVANLALPPEDLMFQVGDENMPWVPVAVLAVLGIWLLATAGSNAQSAAEDVEAEIVTDPDRAALNKRLEGFAWGLFLIILGGFMFVPEQFIKGGWWSIGVGLIMLGLNAARYFNGLKMSGFTTFLGVVSVISGALEVAGLYDLDGAMLLIVLGAYLLIKPYLEKRRLFGKAEEV